MDLATLFALLAAIVALTALALVVRRPTGEGGGAALRESVGAQLQAAQQGAQGQVELLARSVADLRSDLSRALGATEHQLTSQAGTTQRTLSDLSRQLGALSEQRQRIGALAKDIVSHQALLRAPHARGGSCVLLLPRPPQRALPSA